MKPRFIKICYFLLSLFITFFSSAEDYYSSELLNLGFNGEKQTINEDLSVFVDNEIKPGEYHYFLYLNKKKIDSKLFNFVLFENKTGKKIIMPCITSENLNTYGVTGIEDSITLIPSSTCVNFESITNLKLNVDIYNKIIYITLPQSNTDEGKVYKMQQKYWDDGITAAFINYSFSGNNARNEGKDYNNYYLNTRSGFNIGSWRYRNYSILNKNNNGSERWDSVSDTLTRNINSIYSELILGNTYTSSDIFDSVKIKGVKLQSDNSMLPNYLQSYAPNVSGFANSEAVVTITQNNKVIYKNSVPAGPFEISDYFPISNSGNLFVNVNEVDGAEKNFIVPYSSLASLQRKNQLKYSLSIGKYDGNHRKDDNLYNQLDVFYGLTDYVTVYTGSQLSSNYYSFSVGSGLNLGDLGAINVGVIQSNSKIRKNENNERKNHVGKSFKINYTKNIIPTNTNVSIVGYHHFEKDYYSFNDAMIANSDNLDSKNKFYKLKNEYNVSLSQPLPQGFGSINLSSTLYKYHNKKDISSYNFGYYNTYDNITYNIYYTQFKGGTYNTYNTSTFNFNVSIPFLVSDNYVWSSYGLTTDSDNQTLHSVRLNGLGGDRSQYNWGVYQGYGNKSVNYSGGLNGSYRSQYANLSSGYAYSSNRRNISYGVSGSLLASSEGIALTQTLQETNALVKVDGANNVSLLNSQSSLTNSQGLTVYSGLSPYRENTISLDVNSIPENIDIENNILSNIIPTKGAFVLADFKSQHGYKLLVNLKTIHNKEIPIGAMAASRNTEDYLVGNFNQLYIVTKNINGEIFVSWQIDEKSESCNANYDVTNIKPVNGIYIFNVECI